MTINLKDFLARGDNTIAANWSFDRALEILSQRGGGKLFIPQGIYRIEKTFDGYSHRQYEMGTNYGVKIDLSNIIIEGDGPGATVFYANHPSTTFFLFRGLKNITLRNLTLEQPDAAGLYKDCATTLKRLGDPKTPTSFIDQGWTLGTMIYFLGTPNDFIQNVTIENVEFKNPCRHAVGLAYVDGAWIHHNRIRYYDGFPPPVHSQNVLGAGRVGIFSGSEHTRNIVVSENSFNGNVNGNQPTANPDGTYSNLGADGFVWFAKGGHHTVINNQIKNYSLEACHHEALPVRVKDNEFETACGTPSTVACLAYPNSPRAEDIDQPIIEFSGNRILGKSSMGLEMKGPSWNFNPSYATPRYNAVAIGNYFEDCDYPFIAIGADVFSCIANTSFRSKQFFACNIGPEYLKSLPNLDFRCKYLNFLHNNIYQCSNVAFLLNSPLQPEGIMVITGGTVQAPWTALFAEAESLGYSVGFVKTTICLNIQGDVIQPYFYDPKPKGVNFLI